MGKKVFKDPRICPEGKASKFRGGGHSHSLEYYYCRSEHCTNVMSIPKGTSKNFNPLNLRYCKECLQMRKRLADIF